MMGNKKRKFKSQVLLYRQMTDNIQADLYQARYEAFIVGKENYNT